MSAEVVDKIAVMHPHPLLTDEVGRRAGDRQIIHGDAGVGEGL